MVSHYGSSYSLDYRYLQSKYAGSDSFLDPGSANGRQTEGRTKRIQSQKWNVSTAEEIYRKRCAKRPG